MKALDDYHLRIDLKQVYGDPVEIAAGTAVGAVGVMLHNRRRNKLNGVVESVSADRIVLRITHSLGNCPKYIQRELPELCKLTDYLYVAGGCLSNSDFICSTDARSRLKEGRWSRQRGEAGHERGKHSGRRAACLYRKVSVKKLCFRRLCCMPTTDV